jgi:hypothetical protein
VREDDVADPTKKPPPDPPDPHDDREIEVRGIVRVAAIVVVVTLGAAVMMWFFQGMLLREERSGFVEPPPIARSRSLTPAEPRLQPQPPEGLAELRAKEDEILSTYRWIDPTHTGVSLPIDRAIDLLVEHPPPSRAASGVPEEPTSSRPTQSTLGVRGENPQPPATGGHP